MIVSSTPVFSFAQEMPFDMSEFISEFIGTIKVEFQPTQTGGVLNGCTLVYNLVQPDYAYRHGHLISIVGNIAYFTNAKRNMLGLALKIWTRESLDKTAKPEAPYFAYIQSPHGSTASSKIAQSDSDDPGSRLFVYELDKHSMAVLKDLMDGETLKIGFNRQEAGMDVLASLDVHVANTTVSPQGSVIRQRTDDALHQFVFCVGNLAEQIEAQ